jgi:adenylate cyclase
MKRYYWTHIILLSFAITGIMFLLYLLGSPFLDRMELKSLDVRFLTRGEEPAGPFTVLATIDEQSLDEIGKWPWPRRKIAALVDRLSDEGARVIAMDIVFSEPDENNNIRFVERMEQGARKIGLNETRLERFLRQARKEADSGEW